jgi:hypothetical protein
MFIYLGGHRDRLRNWYRPTVYSKTFLDATSFSNFALEGLKGPYPETTDAVTSGIDQILSDGTEVKILL